MNPGLYIHIPFCEQRCYYCAFTVAVSPEHTFEPYVQHLVREIALAQIDCAPGTLYFGGGTPSLLSASSLGRIMKALDCRAGSVGEVTVEVNPGTLSEQKVEGYLELGITRISLGAQSLEDEDLQRAGRLHRAGAVYSDVEMLRHRGFANISLDLIAGLPGQQLVTWERNLIRALDLRPEHISIYMLDHEERSAWSRLPPDTPEEADYAEFYTLAESLLDEAGYLHYEISNWAIPGRECRHNIGYWSGIPYRGFGVGAHSFDGGRRYWNTPSLAGYAESLDCGRLPISGEELLTPEMKLEEAFMLGLRQKGGVNVRDVAAQIGVSFSPGWYARVEQLAEAGWIHVDGDVLCLTRRGRLAANSVIGELIWPAPESTSSI